MTDINPDILSERSNCILKLDEITDIYYNGKKQNDKRKYLDVHDHHDDVQQQYSNLNQAQWGCNAAKKPGNIKTKPNQSKVLAGDVEFSRLPAYDFLSTSEKYSLMVTKSKIFVRLMKQCLNNEYTNDSLALLYMMFPSEAGPITLHLTMFLPVLLTQCSPEQREKWLPLAFNFNIIGTYAQTELGHGTHLRGLETTATYDKKTEQFVLHSPTLTSSKWWPGGLGKSSNHAAVMANLIIDGKSYGMQSFLVQIRSMHDHQPLEGTTVGTIGPKFGYDSMDNGFIRFNKLRIPRENMLSRFSSVSKAGVFKRSGNNKLLYLTMLETRIGIVFDTGMMLGKAATIATRYSVVRRQSEIVPGEGEVKILDHVAQQQRVLPSICEAYAFRFASNMLTEHYLKSSEPIRSGNDELLSEIHCIASALKAFCTEQMAVSMERCRLACGGHGYSDASGLPKLYKYSVPALTYEGDNNILYIQCGKLLLKNVVSSIRKGTKLTDSLNYLVGDLPTLTKDKDLGIDDLQLAFKLRARKTLYRLLHEQMVLRESGVSDAHVHNHTSLLLIAAASSHAHQYVVASFARQARLFASKENRDAMLDAFMLYANDSLIKQPGDFLKYNILSSEQIAAAENRQVALLAKIRDRAVPLVDAFDFTDYDLCSVLGRYDGNVYDNMYKWAQNDPLNKTQVHESYKELRELLNYNSISKL